MVKGYIAMVQDVDVYLAIICWLSDITLVDQMSALHHKYSTKIGKFMSLHSSYEVAPKQKTATLLDL